MPARRRPEGAPGPARRRPSRRRSRVGSRERRTPSAAATSSRTRPPGAGSAASRSSRSRPRAASRRPSRSPRRACAGRRPSARRRAAARGRAVVMMDADLQHPATERNDPGRHELMEQPVRRDALAVAHRQAQVALREGERRPAPSREPEVALDEEDQGHERPRPSFDLRAVELERQGRRRQPLLCR